MNKRRFAKEVTNQEMKEHGCREKKSKAPAEQSKSSVLSQFALWCQSKGMVISDKVQVSCNCVHRFGMVALKPINKSEILFEIPRSMLLWEENNSFEKCIPGFSELQSKSGWVKLLLVLMLEYTDSESKWAEYMKFAPPTEVLDMPIYWPPDIRTQVLGGTPLLSLVEKDAENMENEYRNIALPFIEKNAEFGFDKEKHTLQLYVHMAGFVMAYSFTEPEEESEDAPPKMVPMADVLNHVSKHNAHLQFDKDSLKMVATCDIPSQCEVFNTFGYLSNSQLLQMYGFVEEGSSNVHDTVEIPVDYFKKYPDIQKIKEKWKFLFGDGGTLGGCDKIAIGMNGILSCDETKLILKVLSMSPTEFKSYDGVEWESDSSESDCSNDSESVYVLTYEKFAAFPLAWKSMLKFVGQRMLNDLSITFAEKQDLNFPDIRNQTRKEKIMTILKNQIRILEKLTLACSSA